METATEHVSEAQEDNVVLQNVPPGETFEGPSDEIKIRRAMAESRAERGERPRDEVEIWDGTPVPSTGEHQSSHSAAARASDYMRNMREQDVAESLRTRDGFISALKENSDAVWNATMAGRSEDELAAELVKGKTAPNIVNPVREGVVLKPLGDHTKPVNLTDSDLFENPRAAARSMAEFRDAISRAEKAIVEELDAQTEQQQVERQTAPSVQPQSQPVQRAPAPQAAPQQVDPLARERAAIAQSYQQAQLIQGASEAEQNLAVDIRRHDAWARENFPELNDPTGKALLDLTGSLLRLSERHCLLSLADGRNRRRLRAKKMRNFTHVRADASSA